MRRGRCRSPSFIDHCKAAAPIPLPEAASEVDVSIIVAVYNQWSLTRACLNSIALTSAGSGVRYEVILADDGSTDETVDGRQDLSGPAGRKDVSQRRLSAQLQQCGGAGARALHPSSQQRHDRPAGLAQGPLSRRSRTIRTSRSQGRNSSTRTGSFRRRAARCFRMGTPSTSVATKSGTFRSSTFRERSITSRARQSSFDRISGNRSVASTSATKTPIVKIPTWRCRRAPPGMYVVYQPSSEVIHFEHQTYIGQQASAAKTLQKHNTALLVEKWRNVLSLDHVPVQEWQVAVSNAERRIPTSARRRRQSGQLNILYFSPFPVASNKPW